jgi:NmrA-like family
LIDATRDTGKWVTAILSNPSQTFGKRFPAAAGWITPEELVSTISEVAGIKVSFKQISDEVFKSFLPASAANMRSAALIVCREWNYYGPNAHAELAESLKVGHTEVLTEFTKLIFSL